MSNVLCQMSKNVKDFRAERDLVSDLIDQVISLSWRAAGIISNMASVESSQSAAS